MTTKGFKSGTMEVSLALRWTILETLHKSFPPWLFHIVRWDIWMGKKILIKLCGWQKSRTTASEQLAMRNSEIPGCRKITKLKRYDNPYWLILSADEVEPLYNVLANSVKLFILSVLSLPQLGHKSSQLFFPLVSKCCDSAQILCVLKKKQQKTTFSHDRGTKTCWEHWKGHAWLPLTTGKCCSAQLFLTNSAHWDEVGWRAAASSCQSSGGKRHLMHSIAKQRVFEMTLINLIPSSFSYLHVTGEHTLRARPRVRSLQLSLCSVICCSWASRRLLCSSYSSW